MSAKIIDVTSPTCRIAKGYRIVVTVSKHVVSCENSIRANNPIRIDKTFDLGIIIPGIEVIPSCFGIIIIPAIPDGINVADEGGRSVDVAVTIGD